MIYICIPSYGRLELTAKCIESVSNQSIADYQIIICEHSTSEEPYKKLRTLFPKIVVLRGNENMWWTAATNTCVRHVLDNGTDKDYVFTLNNDTELDANCLKVLMASASEKPNAIIGCVNLLHDNKSLIEPSAQRQKRILGLRFYKSVNKWKDSIRLYEGEIKVDALSGKGILIPISVFKRVGIYNEVLLPHYHADTEFTIRATKAGHSAYLNYSALLYSNHIETGITARKTDNSIKEFIRGFKNLKSTRHYSSLKNRAKLIYGKPYPLYLSIKLIGLFLGFIKRKSISFLYLKS